MKRQFLPLLAICLISCSEPGFHDNHVIAHRGAWKDTGLPQNSLASFTAAAEMGCHGSECDVWISADDSLVICHDATRDGKRIDEMTYEEVISVPLSNGEKIPTLREYVLNARNHPRTKLIIDLKPIKVPERSWLMLQKIDQLVKELDYEQNVEYILNYHPLYDEFSELTDQPITYLGHWRDELPEMYPDSVYACGIKCVDYKYIHYEAHPEWVESFKENNIHLNVWTVNDEESMKKFLNLGFDYITTDHPALLLSIE